LRTLRTAIDRHNGYEGTQRCREGLPASGNVREISCHQIVSGEIKDIRAVGYGSVIVESGFIMSDKKVLAFEMKRVPSKLCEVCGDVIAFTRRTARDWEKIQYCSAVCRRAGYSRLVEHRSLHTSCCH
jgi:hypothetical protein